MGETDPGIKPTYVYIDELLARIRELENGIKGALGPISAVQRRNRTLRTFATLHDTEQELRRLLDKAGS